jgi:glycosyltransferase involved in cell wall biosynthesis|tara:strand:+ start:10868 stop:11980 length:1113 start_codon:yes stop_codon:yes gene_type:complete
MKVIMLSTDHRAFEEGSNVRLRFLDYGSIVDELHIIVFSKEGDLAKEQIAQNVWLYPIKSKNRLIALSQIRSIAKSFENIDIVSAQDPFETGVVGLYLSKSLGSSFHVQVHTNFLSTHFAKLSKMNAWRVHIAGFVLPRADCVRTVSRRVQKSIYEKYTLKTEPVVLPVFVDSMAIKHAVPTKDIHGRYSRFDFVFLMVSRLEREKDISLAVRAMRSVVKEHPKAGLVIVGSGSEGKKLQKYINKSGLQDTVILEQWNTDVISYYKTADVFINTSRYEGYGRTLIEAASAGCPIITTDVGIVGDILDREDIFVCNVGGIKCVEKSIRMAIEEEEMRKEKALRALRSISMHASESKEEYLARYRHMLESCM